jgi:hypothetical protein
MGRPDRGRAGTAAGKGVAAGALAAPLPALAGGAGFRACGRFFAAVGSPAVALHARMNGFLRAFRPESDDRR